MGPTGALSGVRQIVVHITGTGYAACIIPMKFARISFQQGRGLSPIWRGRTADENALCKICMVLLKKTLPSSTTGLLSSLHT